MPDCDCEKYETRWTYTKCPHWEPFSGKSLLHRILHLVLVG